MEEYTMNHAESREKAPESVSYIVYESSMTRHERTLKRVVIALVVAIVGIIVSNAIWLWAWTSYDYTSDETITVDGKDGIASYIGNDGSIYYGEDRYTPITHTNQEDGQE